MRRRDFIILLSGAVPGLAADRAYRQAVKCLTSGVLFLGRGDKSDPSLATIDAFIPALGELGYTEGRNMAFERKFADGNANSSGRWRRNSSLTALMPLSPSVHRSPTLQSKRRLSNSNCRNRELLGRLFCSLLGTNFLTFRRALLSCFLSLLGFEHVRCTLSRAGDHACSNGLSTLLQRLLRNALHEGHERERRGLRLVIPSHAQEPRARLGRQKASSYDVPAVSLAGVWLFLR